VHVAVMDMPPILAFGISAARHGVVTVEPMPVRDSSRAWNDAEVTSLV
jgi:hypothetical protein